MASGRLDPGMGITTGDLASIQTSVTGCGVASSSAATWANDWNAAPMPAALLMLPSGLRVGSVELVQPDGVDAEAEQGRLAGRPQVHR